MRTLFASLPGVLVSLAAGCGTVTPPPGVDAGGPPPGGSITYSIDGRVLRAPAVAGGAPDDVSARLPGGGADRRLNVSPGGTWYVLETGGLDPACAGSACLAVAPVGAPASAALVSPGGARVEDAAGLSAVDDTGALVVYAAGGGPHARDLFATRRTGAAWSAPVLLTAASPFEWNDQPALHADGTRLLFDCGPVAYAAGDGASICEVASDGGDVAIVADATDAPPGVAHAGPLHHADYTAGGLVFEADWDGERIWRKDGRGVAAITAAGSTGDGSPCVLPDGRVASLFTGGGAPAIKLMELDGGGDVIAVAGAEVLDVGLGCGR